MDRFLTYSGEQPIFLDDFNFIQNSILGSLANCLVAITGKTKPNNIIVSGCKVLKLNDSISWTDGIVILGGEILPIRAGNLTSSLSLPLYFAVRSTYDPQGEREMKDGSTKQCYQIREAVITNIYTDAPLSSSKQLSELLLEYGKSKQYNVTDASESSVVKIYRNAYGEFSLDARIYLQSDGRTQTLLAKSLVAGLSAADADSIIDPLGTITTMAYIPGSNTNAQALPVKIVFEKSSNNTYVTITLPDAIELSAGRGNISTKLYQKSI